MDIGHKVQQRSLLCSLHADRSCWCPKETGPVSLSFPPSPLSLPLPSHSLSQIANLTQIWQRQGLNMKLVQVLQESGWYPHISALQRKRSTVSEPEGSLRCQGARTAEALPTPTWGWHLPKPQGDIPHQGAPGFEGGKGPSRHRGKCHVGQGEGRGHKSLVHATTCYFNMMKQPKMVNASAVPARNPISNPTSLLLAWGDQHWSPLPKISKIYSSS